MAKISEARQFVHKLGLKNVTEWRAYTKTADFPDFCRRSHQLRISNQTGKAMVVLEPVTLAIKKEISTIQ